MLEGVNSAIIAGVGMAIYVDGQLKIGGYMYFWPILESGECVCVYVCLEKGFKFWPVFAFSPLSVN